MQNLFSYPLKIEDMSALTQNYKLKANNEELKYITEIMQVPNIKRFETDINVKFQAKEHRVDVWGNVNADVEQTSVISLENFDRKYCSEFKLIYDTKMTLSEQIALDEENDGENVPDILVDGQIDLAAIAMEQLALILDDFPRQEGEVFNFTSEFDEETTKKANPFAVLEKLKK